MHPMAAVASLCQRTSTIPADGPTDAPDRWHRCPIGRAGDVSLAAQLGCVERSAEEVAVSCLESDFGVGL